MIPLRDQELLRLRFAQDLTSRVPIDLFTQRPSPLFVAGRQECQYCGEAESLMEELASLSGRLTLTRHELGESSELAASLGVERLPCVVLRGPSNRPLRFSGLPTGGEFPSFIETLIETSRSATNIEPATQRTLKRIRSEVQLQVLVSPSCLYSPPVALGAFRLALSNVKIKTEVLEVLEFPQLIQRHHVQSTPTIVINEKLVLPGAMDEPTLADCLLRAVEGKPLSSTLTVGPMTPLPQSNTQEVQTAPSGLIIPR